MKCVMVMFDSLNRHMLPGYDPKPWVHAPNFQRLSELSARFTRSYVCSMPCMPARRDLHTGRPNFLHCPWGPIEPFDDSLPSILSAGGVYTHLASDHYHYWENGGATYHTRYTSWECFRGQENDPCIGQVRDPEIPTNINAKGSRPGWMNREHFVREVDLPQSKTFEAGIRFIDRNHQEDQWFLQIECFDPHEPFVAPAKYRDIYEDDPVGMPLFDCPPYSPVTESEAEVESCRKRYAALVSQCDASLGKVLDAFDRHDLWEDTMLIVWTDHGFLLGEHRWWGKGGAPLYEEISHTPFFVWDPRSPEAAGTLRDPLVQPSIDLAPTLLDFFGMEATPSMVGKNLASAIAANKPVRDYAIFGYFGKAVNITDGRFTYYRVADPGGELFAYTLMPTSMRSYKSGIEDAQLVNPLPHSKGMPLLRLPCARPARDKYENLLFDLDADPGQVRPLTNATKENELCIAMRKLMEEAGAPREQFTRMDLSGAADADRLP
jgi:arylsulfatase A-like enzyme